ncbi:hypothetical protein [Vibrio rumoiensis]|uniref:hypothetical protein n=1 Tax=Vibrio rumoiensis TaxID=76258 RepID=UPI003AA9C84B
MNKQPLDLAKNKLKQIQFSQDAMSPSVNSSIEDAKQGQQQKCQSYDVHASKGSPDDSLLNNTSKSVFGGQEEANQHQSVVSEYLKSLEGK